MSETKQVMNSIKGLSTKWAGQDFRYVHVTGSTNDDCMQALLQGAPHGVVVAAGQQTGGKGRSGRSWSSPPGECVYITLGLKPEFPPENASALTLVMALAVVKAVEDCLAQSDRSEIGAGETDENCVSDEHGEKIQIKWPNDIVVNGRKVCGILTEMRLDGRSVQGIVIGVGINSNRMEFDADIALTATSLKKEFGHPVDHQMLIQSVLQYFEIYYEKYVEKCDMSALMEEYEQKLANKDKEVRVHDPHGEYTATALGINESGELIVRKEDGTQEAVYAGEVSVRGIYGYV